MDAIAKATRQSFQMRGRSYVALAFCPVVPIAGWLEEIDITLARSPGLFAGKPVVLDLSAVDLSQSAIAHRHQKPGTTKLMVASPRSPTACRRAAAVKSWYRARKRRLTSISGPARR